METLRLRWERLEIAYWGPHGDLVFGLPRIFVITLLTLPNFCLANPVFSTFFPGWSWITAEFPSFRNDSP